MKWMTWLLVVALTVASGARASDTRPGDTPEIVPSPELVVMARHNPQTFNYANGLKVVERFERLSAEQRSHVQLKFYVEPKRSRTPIVIDELELALDTGVEVLPIRVSESGELNLPRLDPDVAKDAVLVSTLPRGSVKIVYKIDLALPQDMALTAGWLRTAVGQAKSAWKAVLPAVARKAVPTFRCAEFQVLGPARISLDEPDHVHIWNHAATPLEPAKWPLASEATDAARFTIGDGPLRRVAACKK